MGCEIERKFLVRDDSWKEFVQERIAMRQKYLPLRDEKHSSGRIRIAGDRAFLTLKTARHGIIRGEYEYEIPRSDAEELFQLICTGSAVEKVRHLVVSGGKRWEIDVFSGDNAGLVVAEIELKSEEETFEPPSWLGQEISGDHRFANSNLAQRPWKTWKEEERPSSLKNRP